MYDVYIMKRTQIYLPEELHYQLSHLAKREKTSLAHIIRIRLKKSIDQSLTSKKKNFFEALEEMGKKFQKSNKKLPRDLSSRHTEYYLETVLKSK